MIQDVIERVSQDPSLSIVTEYGRITIKNVWYRYDAKRDCLLREQVCLTKQQDLLELQDDERH